VGAGIDHKVLQAHPQICKPGTAMVLRDVTFLKMSHVPYLCITLPNIAKVRLPLTLADAAHTHILGDACQVS
jgi:hypothetical protein